MHALAFRGATVKRRKGSVYPHLIHEHQPSGADLRGHHHPPGGPQELVSLRGASPPFLRVEPILAMARHMVEDRKSTRLNSSHANISYAVFCLKKKIQGDELTN